MAEIDGFLTQRLGQGIANDRFRGESQFDDDSPQLFARPLLFEQGDGELIGRHHAHLDQDVAQSAVLTRLDLRAHPSPSLTTRSSHAIRRLTCSGSTFVPGRSSTRR